MSSDLPRFYCNYAGCARSYKKKEHLLRHERDHLNLRPFACTLCPATFNRSDLLKRHGAISHQSNQTPERNDQGEPSTENAVSESQKSAPASEPVDNCLATSEWLLSIELEGLNLSSNPAMQLLQSSSRNELEASYFLHFHPHWPLLHKKTFLHSEHPPELTAAVLTAGLWVLDTPETRDQARFYHDALLKVLDHQLFKLCQCITDSPGPRAEFLASFQVLLIALILCTYRGAETFRSAFMNSKHLWQLFQSVDIYDQKAIDDRNSSRIIRECYQRLALLHFKVHVHLNSILLRHFPQFKTLDYLTPCMLKVRIPLPSYYWEGDDAAFPREGEGAGTVADLLVPCTELTHVSDLVAWDFTLGMVIGCYLVRPSKENHRELIKRLDPYLFLHLKSGKDH
ncbi:uncharacterized protein FOBCDRAFT_245710 [Fusarium oxysporum Fo47]|uniref:C2H2-type domain-containing protein n=1 Tax=Fusarium oxysporum Fo47 TaxID=660027 RepID=W9JC59_FUSOX|nr:uncharacterized protein FOBCDRAFT_245710 [Fusarium oxysporum Fo47]EWZ29456.1 hypothetical protein FOZG_16829 [Fusarium oxysporum Fo47]WJG37244.1 hypothetical protein FOBCDRAFT_245710 [Fusarium oxysporum Fo47]